MTDKTCMEEQNFVVGEQQFPPEVIDELDFYVYVYIDPRDQKPFYIGRGKENRAFSHLMEEGKSEKLQKIKAIKASGHQPQIEILRHGLTEDQSTLVEAAAIDLLGLDSLTNLCRGLHSRSFGRVSATDILLTYGAKDAECTDPMILITINRLYRSGMGENELYEATRGIWKIGKRRESAKLACAVYQGVIRETYVIDRWQSAGTDKYFTRDDSEFAKSGRWEFRGSKASDDVRCRYNRRSVRHLLAAHAQNPIRYINCK
jgi:hypothetical protein